MQDDEGLVDITPFAPDSGRESMIFLEHDDESGFDFGDLKVRYAVLLYPPFSPNEVGDMSATEESEDLD